MNKYIDAEKLKAEIEQRRDKYLNDCLVQGHIKAAELDDLLLIINSLQQEEPTEVDLEKFIDNWKARFNHTDNTRAFTAEMLYTNPDVVRK